MTVDTYEVGLAVIGLAALIAAWLPAYTADRPISLPVVLVGFGAAVFALALGLPTPDPRAYPDAVERITEFAVIVSLMGAGLKIDRPFSLAGWSSTWRMLALVMPMTVAGTALAGVAVGGLAAVSAVLLGAALAPTDPVLASDVQVGEPTLDDDEPAEDEVRFALTSEAGLNDALAFPFVYAAIRIAESGWDPSGWTAAWLAWDVVGRLAIAVTVGVVVGRVLGIIAFHPPGKLTALAATPQGFVAIAATLLAYGATELVQGYGFLAVFVAAVALRGSERQHAMHKELHDFSQQVENLLVVGLLVLFGGSLVSGVLDHLTWRGLLVACMVVFVVRPLAARVSLGGLGMSGTERWTIAFFGIRGVGSIYYLTYALTATDFAEGETLWSIVSATLLLSILIHGVTATPAMRLVNRIATRSGRTATP